VEDKKYRWECPDCHEVVTSWSDYGCAMLVKAHKLDHTIETFNTPRLDYVKVTELTPFDVVFLDELKVGW